MIQHKPRRAVLLLSVFGISLILASRIEVWAITAEPTRIEVTPELTGAQPVPPATAAQITGLTAATVAPSPSPTVTEAVTGTPISPNTSSVITTPSAATETPVPTPSETRRTPTTDPSLTPPMVTPTGTASPTEIPTASPSPSALTQTPTPTPTIQSPTSSPPPNNPPDDSTGGGGQTQANNESNTQGITASIPTVLPTKTIVMNKKSEIKGAVSNNEEVVGKINQILSRPLTFSLRGVSMDAYPEEKVMSLEERQRWLLGGIVMIVLGTFLADPSLGNILKNLGQQAGRLVSKKDLYGFINRLL